MNTLECIKTRRSRRLFVDKEVGRDLINQIIETGVCAPSSRDCQPWHFIVIRDQEIQKQLADLKSEGNQQHIITAPVSIVVCVDTEKSPNSYIEDGISATQNMLLAIHDLGLGSVYISAGSKIDSEITGSIRKILNLSDIIYPAVILPIGYPDENEELEKKDLLNIKEVTHNNKW